MDEKIFKNIASTMKIVEKREPGMVGKDKKRIVQLLLREQFEIDDSVSNIIIEAMFWSINHKSEISAFIKKNCCCCG